MALDHGLANNLPCLQYFVIVTKHLSMKTKEVITNFVHPFKCAILYLRDAMCRTCSLD